MQQLHVCVVSLASLQVFACCRSRHTEMRHPCVDMRTGTAQAQLGPLSPRSNALTETRSIIRCTFHKAIAAGTMVSAVTLLHINLICFAVRQASPVIYGTEQGLHTRPAPWPAGPHTERWVAVARRPAPGRARGSSRGSGAGSWPGAACATRVGRAAGAAGRLCAQQPVWRWLWLDSRLAWHLCGLHGRTGAEHLQTLDRHCYPATGSIPVPGPVLTWGPHKSGTICNECKHSPHAEGCANGRKHLLRAGGCWC